jgi:YHYH protein
MKPKSYQPRIASGLVLTINSLVAATRLGAAVLSVDINAASQAGNTQTGFDPLTAPVGTFTIMNGTFGGVALTVAGLGESLSSLVRALPTNNISTNAPKLTSAALYQDFMFGGNNVGNGLAVTLSGLTAFQTYSVKIWSFDSGSTGSRVSDWTANGLLVAEKFTFDGSELPTDANESAFSFTVTASSSGGIYITGIHDASQAAGTAVFLNAIQVSTAATTTVPNPYTTSWLTANSGIYARIYTNDAAKTAGNAVATWSNGTQTQSTPAYAGVQELYSSPSWLYIRSTGLGSHIMGPWLNGAFPNLPKNQKVLYRIPEVPTVSATKTLTGLGAIGYFVDGVAMFDSRDAFYWNGTADANGTGSWNREAYVNEGATFDPGYAHQENTGTHHYHADPVALRYQLGDHMNYNASTKNYSESTNAVTKHSPILGWVRDGYPVYGPYGYANATNSASPLTRMRSGYVLRNGQNGTQNLTVAGRTNIPLWAVRLYNVSAGQSGPNVSASYPLDRYMEDNDYLGDLGYAKGVDFDLDDYNGRFCVTPEFPTGTYAYFVSINSNGVPTFPYNIGRAFYGNPTGSAVTSITEAVTTNFLGGPNLPAVLNNPSLNNGIVTLTWSALEGGTYQVESSSNLSAWTTKASGIAAAFDNGSYTGASPESIKFFRVARTALASYDPASGTTGSGGGNGILSVSPTSGNRGAAAFTLTINLDPSVNPPPQQAPINSVTVGTINGTSNVHVSQTQVTSSITIPAGATTGPQTVTVVFPGPPTNPTATVTYTLPNGFTIN